MSQNQFLELIKKSRNLLISAVGEIEGDHFCGALALFYTLNNLGKKVNLNISRPFEKLQFLTDDGLFNSTKNNKVLISINTRGEKIEKIFYEKDEGELKFYLDLKKGNVDIEKISLKTKEDPDLIIDIQKQGFAFRDNDSGKTNTINYFKSSICETIIEILKSDEGLSFDKNTATCLLAGLICCTQSFQNSKTNPKILECISFLIEKGADYQKIIQEFHKTKSLSEIKLLGKVLSKLNFNSQKDIAWCSLSEKDFEDSNSSSKNLSFVLEIIKSNFSLPQTMFVLWEGHSSPVFVKGIFYSAENKFLQKITQNFESISKNQASLFFIKNVNLKEAEEKILNLLN